MADKQIGIRLDVRQTGLEAVSDNLISISKNLADVEEATSGRNSQGWGSDAQTKELREQLLYMERIAGLHERIAKATGGVSAPASTVSGPTSSSYGGGGERTWSQRTFGNDLSAGLEKLSRRVAQIGTAMLGIGVMSTIYSGLGRGDQLNYGYGDITKRLGVQEGKASDFAKESANSFRGYGYDTMNVLGASNMYAQTTGRMSYDQFQSDMGTMLGMGRRYGWADAGQSASVFADATDTGIISGSAKQMNPEEFANLIGQAVAEANMDGREMAMIQQMQQLTQLSIATTASAGDTKTTAGLLALGMQGGDRAFIGQMPSMFGSINSAITNPTGGYNGQALMMRALGGGQTDYWELMYQQSLGLDGSESSYNGKSNLENATNYLMNAFKGDKYRQYNMLGQQFGLSPAMAKKFIDSYTENGQFRSEDLEEAKRQLDNPLPEAPVIDTDTMRAESLSAQDSADIAGMNTTGTRSKIKGLFGDVMDSPVGTGLSYVAPIATGATSAYGTYALGKRMFDSWRNRKNPTGATGSTPKVPKAVTPSAPTAQMMDALDEVAVTNEIDNKPAPTNAGSKGVKSVGGGMSKLMDRLGLLGSMIAAPDIASSLWDWGFGHKKGDVKDGRGFNNFDTWDDSRMGIIGRLMYGEDKKEDAKEVELPRASAISSENATQTGQDLVPIVISTIIALQPYMSKLQGYMSGGSTGQNGVQLTPYMGNNPGVTLPTFDNRSSNPSGLMLAANQMLSATGNSPMFSFGGDLSNGMKMLPFMNFGGSGGSGGSSALPANLDRDSFVKQMLPYAQKVASATGLPAEMLLTQWGIESGWGSSNLARENNNFAGIKNWKGSKEGKKKGWAGYDDLDDFADGVTKFYTQNKRYKDLLKAAKDGKSSEDLIKMLGKTGYAEESDYADVLTNSLGGVRKSLDAGTINKSSGGSKDIQIKSGTVTVALKTDDGKKQDIKIPIQAEWTGLLLT